MQLIKNRPETYDDMEFVDDHPMVQKLRDEISTIESREAELVRQIEEPRAVYLKDKVNAELARIDGRAPDTAALPDMKELREELLVQRGVKSVKEQQLKDALQSVATELRAKYTASRQKLLQTIDRDLLGLIANVERYESFIDACERAGIVTPGQRVGGKWMSAVLAIGGSDLHYTLERLKAWRNEFKQHGYLHQ